ncbi:MAG TPA: hypothetical protein VJ853_10170 [Thermoanaerobaculia bacterium]|nr:hypothetical protein [Thermoanaerobaculia bacterium]
MVKRAAAGMCKKGLHKMTKDNVYQHPAKGPECRACKRNYMRGYMRKARAKASARPAKRRRKSA